MKALDPIVVKIDTSAVTRAMEEAKGEIQQIAQDGPLDRSEAMLAWAMILMACSAFWFGVGVLAGHVLAC